MHGYKNFYEDVSLAFKDLLATGKLAFKNSGRSASQSATSHVILESESQFVSLLVERASVVMMLVEKKSRKFIYANDLLQLMQVDVEAQRKLYFDAIYEEAYSIKSLPIPEQADLLADHICLGELYTYAKLMETVLYKFVFDPNESWVDLAEQNGIALYESKLDDFTV